MRADHSDLELVVRHVASERRIVARQRELIAAAQSAFAMPMSHVYRLAGLASITTTERQLAQHEFVADDYSIADIAIWPWVSRYEWQTVDLNAYANVKRWYTVIASRPAVQRGYKVPKDVGEIPMP